MEEGVLLLKWNNYQSTFSNVLSSLHLKELYSDVTIACSGKFFPAHKLILSVCSSYFEDIFKHTTCTHPVVVLKDILHDDMEMLLKYMYSGEVNVPQSNLARLIKAAECLRIKGLCILDKLPVGNENKRCNTDTNSECSSTKRRRDGTFPSLKKMNRIQVKNNSVAHDSSERNPREHFEAPPVDHQQVISSGYSKLTNEDGPNQSHSERTSNVAEVLSKHREVKEEVVEIKEEDGDEKPTVINSEQSLTCPPSSVDTRERQTKDFGVESFDPHCLPSYPQNLAQDMVQNFASSSGVPGESLPGWDCSENVQRSSPEYFPLEDSETQTAGLSIDSTLRLRHVEAYLRTGSLPPYKMSGQERQTFFRFTEKFQLSSDGEALYYIGSKKTDKRLVIFDEESKKQVLTECHDGPGTGGHLGVVRTQKKVTTSYYWMDITKDVKLWIQACLQCQKHETIKTQDVV